MKKDTKTAPAITREDKGTQTELSLERMEHVWASQVAEPWARVVKESPPDSRCISQRARGRKEASS